MRHKTELERLGLIEGREGRVAALAFAQRVYGAYRHVLRHGYRVSGSGRLFDENNRRGGHGLVMRRSLVESCLSFREYLRLNKEIYDLHLERLKRKRDQAWELAGLARQDGDKADEVRHTVEAKDYSRQIAEWVK